MKRFFIILIYCILYANQILAQTDSLGIAVAVMPEDSLKINALIELSEMQKKTDVEQAVQTSDAAAELSKKTRNPKKEALALKNSGNFRYSAGDYPAAYAYYQQSLEIFKNINDQKGTSILLRNIGSVFHQQGNYEQALSYFNESLSIREKIGDKAGIAALYNAIGLLYMEQGESTLADAATYFRKSMGMYRALGQSAGVASTYYSLGALFSRQNNTDSALFYYQNYLSLADELKNDVLKSKAHYALGAAYTKIENYTKADIHITQAINYCLSTSNTFDLAGSYFTAGELYFHQKKFATAEQFAKKSYETAEKIGAIIHLKNAAELLQKLAQLRGDYKEALLYSDIYIQLKDSLLNANLTESIAKFQMQLDFNNMLKEKELNVQKRDLEHKARLQQQKIYTVSSVVALLLAIGMIGFVLKSLKTKKTANKILTEKNAQILFQNEAIQQKSEEIRQQNEEISKQHKEIVDSINYAKRIQQAILPTEHILSEMISEHFVFFKPRDIVSGDFYWAKQIKNYTICAVADCTGHGVPGAFMSMLGTSFLNEIVTSRSMDSSGEILDKLRNKVKKSLNQTGADGEQKDGMDISFVIIDNETYELDFAGAYNSLYILRNNKIYTLNADRQPIGIFIKEIPFTSRKFKLEKGDCIYALTDGYIDQFGGTDGSKFKIKRFKDLLLQIYTKPMSEQIEILDSIFTEWKQNMDQIDDVLVFAVKM